MTELNEQRQFEGLFVFGFETPAMHASNLSGGWDDELSAYFFVKAPDEQLALRVGGELADRYVAWLWDRRGSQMAAQPSWTAGAFACWLEPCALRDGLEEVIVKAAGDSFERIELLDGLFLDSGDEVLPVVVKVTRSDAL